MSPRAIARGEVRDRMRVAGVDGGPVGARAEPPGVAPLERERRIARRRFADDDVDAADEPGVARQRQRDRRRPPCGGECRRTVS